MKAIVNESAKSVISKALDLGSSITLTSITLTPTAEAQTVTATTGYAYNQITVEAIPTPTVSDGQE